MKILVPIDGSQNALRALKHVLDKQSWYAGGLELHLLNVQYPVASGGVKMFIPQAELNAFYEEQGQAALKVARELAQASGVAVHARVGVGDLAGTIVSYASGENCDLIVMGTRGMGTVASMLLGSVTTKVIHLTDIPVLLVK